MLLAYQQIMHDVRKGQFAPVYMLFGEEEFLIEKSIRLLVEGIEKVREEVDVDTFYADEVKPGEIVSRLATTSLFGVTRVAIVKRAVSAVDDGSELVDMIADPPPETYLILVANSVDKRNRLYKAAKKHGRTLEFKALKAAPMRKWLEKRLKESGINLTRKQVSFLLSACGDRLRKLDTEVKKIELYCGDSKSVDDESLLRLIGTSNRAVSEYLIFDFVDAVAEKKTGSALKLLNQLLEFGRPALVILTMIARQLRLLIKAAENTHMGQKDLASALGIPEFVAGKLLKQGRNFTCQQLVDALEQILAVDSAIKSGKDERLALEVLVARLTARSPAERKQEKMFSPL